MSFPAIRITAIGEPITVEVSSFSITVNQPGKSGQSQLLSTIGDLDSLVTFFNPFDATVELIQPVPGSTSATDIEDAAQFVIAPGECVQLTIDAEFVPQIEQIARAIESRLQSVVSSVECNGSRINVIRPARIQWKQFDVEHLLVMLVQDAETYIEDRPQRLAERQQDFSIVMFAVPQDDDLTPVETILNQLRADIIQRVMDDPQFDGLAVDSWFPQAVNFQPAENEYEGMILTLTVQYRTRLNDEYQPF